MLSGCAVTVNYILDERSRLTLIYLKQSPGKHWYIALLVHTHTLTHTYMHAENEFNVVTSFKAVSVRRAQAIQSNRKSTQGKINKFGP